MSVSEVPKQHFKKCETGSSRNAGMALPEVPEPHPNYKDKRKKEKSHTESSQSVSPRTGSEELERPQKPVTHSLGEQAQLAQILENCDLWIFDEETAKVFANAIERLFYSDSFRIGKAVLPQANVRSRLWDLDGTILQAAEGKLRQNQQNIRNSTAYTMAVIFNTICEAHSDVLVDPYLNGTGPE